MASLSLGEEENAVTFTSPAVTGAVVRKPRFLCLHGFRTSGEIMKRQIFTKWPDHITARLDLVFLDGPMPAEGKSDVDGIFDPPYYEWFQFDKGFLEYRNFDEALIYIEEQMIKHGPFDGLMGFSQGAIISAALPGLQERGVALTRVPKLKYVVIIGVALTRVPKLKYVVIIGGAKLRKPVLVENAYAYKNKCLSLHFIGALDFLRKYGEELKDVFVDPYVIRHPRGHTVPRIIDEKSMEIMLSYLQRIEEDLMGDAILISEQNEEDIQL